MPMRTPTAKRIAQLDIIIGQKVVRLIDLKIDINRLTKAIDMLAVLNPTPTRTTSSGWYRKDLIMPQN